jgi:hypothetical protein
MFGDDGLTSTPRRPEIDRRQHTNDEMHPGPSSAAADTVGKP